MAGPFVKDAVLDAVRGYPIQHKQNEHQVYIHRDARHTKQNLFVETKAKRKIIRAGRRFGKTFAAARIAVEGFLAKRRVLYAAPTTEQLERFWREVCWSLDEPISANVFKKNETEHSIEVTKSEQRIRAKTAWNADTLRGDYADILILDEWQLMNEDTWEYVGQPMLLDNNGDAVFIYTPPSLHSRSTTKANDPRHASKMFKAAQEEMARAEKENRVSKWLAVSGTSYDNPNLSREALDEVSTEMSSVAYRQEILAEDTEESPGALWKREQLDRNRVITAPVDLIKVVVAIDPPGGTTEAGIVAAAIAHCACQGKSEIHGFVLEDASERNTPEGWASTVADVYHRHDADRVIAEMNFGGDMVESTMRTADSSIPVLKVHASRGKAVRAEPISALDEQGRIHHVGRFPDMEDELCSWVPGSSSRSPNRLDARVWALTALMLGIRKRNRPRAW